jgi:hypothetical protein
VTRRVRLLRLGGLGLVLAAAAVVVWALLTGDDNASSGNKVKPQLIEAKAGQLPALASAQGHEVYWAGPKGGVRYEWTRISNGRIYVRYLSGNAKLGESKRAFLTVATYPFPNALSRLKSLAAKNRSAQTKQLADGSFAYYDATAVPSSAYVAFPGSNFEVEVFDLTPGKAYALARTGQIEEIK